MNYHQLGQSDLQISEIGYGCMSLKNDEATNINLLRTAFDNGINYFDTADIYDNGTNETCVGKAFLGIRDKVIIATKGGNQPREDGNSWNWNASKNYILSAAEASLRRLNTDYIDLYQLHGGTIDDRIDETIEAFELLKKQGKIRHYGISSIRPNVIREYISRSSICSVMLQYSLLDRRPEEGILPFLREHHIGILARGSVAQGLLINKSAKPYLDHSTEEVHKAAAAIQQVSDAYRSPTQTTLKFVLQQPGITAAITGMRTTDQLNEAIAASNTADLKEVELSFLNSSVPAHFYKDHR